MIIDHIRNKAKYQAVPWLLEALEAMESITETDFQPGQIIIDEDRLFLNCIAYNSKKQEECFFESHEKYTDVHFILAGEETLGHTEVNQLKTIREYLSEDDAELYEGSIETQIKMTPGWFAVFLPNEPHLVGLQVDNAIAVKKIVAKVAH